MDQENPRICKECKHYVFFMDICGYVKILIDLEEGCGVGTKPFRHNCMAKAKEKINYITGETVWAHIKDCQVENLDGGCSLFELEGD
jgi:hypothetical protein